MPIRLTEIAVRNLRTPTRQTTYWDTVLPRFGIRVGQAGTKAWVVQLGTARKRFITIGRFPDLSLKDARTEAKRLIASPPVVVSKTRYCDAVDQFLSDREERARERTVADYRRLLARHFAFGTRKLASITASELRQVLAGLAHVPSERRHAFVAARTFFSFCVRRGLLASSPMASEDVPSLPLSRERVLSDDEIRAVWKTAAADATPFKIIVRLCLLTGLRRGEAAMLRWEWIDLEGKTISLPASATKNGRAHTLPFGELAQFTLKLVDGRSGYVFPGRADEDKFFNGWSRSKKDFDLECPLANWTLHDLRRTFATRLAAAGTPIHITERLLNHVSGTLSGVAAVYNRHNYLAEMREAITAWEAELTRLITDKDAGGANPVLA